jgi:6-pyruvoyltetrahydropterin/6-carboxytetrahydropterin synthase
MEQFHVRISTDDLIFSAAHFITLEGDTCERLHGHNYRVAAEVHGPLDESHYVVDFIALRETLRAIIEELDHHVILPSEHPLIRVAAEQEEVEVRFAERRWVFPRSDCLLLPIANTTTELLARYVGQRLLDALASRTGRRPALVRIEIEECYGLWATCGLRGE